MGVVWAGTHVLLGTPVAIKVIHSELKGDSEVVQRFINEARAAAALKGEHIARVFDVGMLESGEPYLVMEQLEGMSLDLYLAGRGPLTLTEAADIVLQVCEGLAEAHAAGLVHRDIKPANLFLARRPDEQLSVKILDFGIAKRLDATSPALTDPGKGLGSPWYMSPEQMLTPARVDARADVWSLGVLLFELVTARLPFEGDSVPNVCAHVLAASPLRPSDHRGDIGLELDAIVLRCLEKEPAQRFDSVSELGRALLPLSSTAHRAAAPEPLPYFEARQAPSYDSLTPIQGATGDGGARWPGWRSAWPVALALVVVAVVAPRVWLQYLDPRLGDGGSGAVLGTADLMPDAGAAGDAGQGGTMRTGEYPVFLQYLDEAFAVTERERPREGSVRVRRGEGEDDWERAERVKRMHEAENRYGL
jgi:serine/threonine-protein kinase